MLGLDALGSSSYGPEAPLTVLIPLVRRRPTPCRSWASSRPCSSSCSSPIARPSPPIPTAADRFALSLSEDVDALHVVIDDEGKEAIKDQWRRYVDEPLAGAGCAKPVLRIVRSPHRRLLGPLLDFLRETLGREEGRTVAVVIPELVEAKWYQYLLHNQRSTVLKAGILLHGGRRVVVVNVPWYPEEPDQAPSYLQGRGAGALREAPNVRPKDDLLLHLYRI